MEKTPLRYYKTTMEKYVVHEKSGKETIDHIIAMLALSPQDSVHKRKERAKGFELLFKHIYICDQIAESYKKDGLFQLGPLITVGRIQEKVHIIALEIYLERLFMGNITQNRKS